MESKNLTNNLTNISRTDLKGRPKTVSMLFNANFILLNLAGLKCCNVYSDFCDTMETQEEQWITDQPLARMKREEGAQEDEKNITKHQMASRVSQILDNLFGGGYNKQFRPGQFSAEGATSKNGCGGDVSVVMVVVIHAP